MSIPRDNYFVKSDISGLLAELHYSPDHTLSILKTIRYLKSKQHLHRKFSFNNIIRNGTPIFSLYPDQIIARGKSSIKILDQFISKYFPNLPAYILPCWEATGDGGFSIKDFTRPRKQVGTLKDLKNFFKKRPVCLDMVYSNVSVESNLVKNHLKSPYRAEHSIVAECLISPLKGIPSSHRGHPAIRRFKTANEERYLWTTFSPHQINLNYSSPRTLIWLLKTLAFYLDTGASSIRLDAVPFSWTTESGPILNAPECHTLVKIIRNFIDYYKPGTLLIAQSDYASKPLHDYIGDENKEAHILYRHEIAPILIHAIISGQKIYLQKWIADVAKEHDQNWISFLSTCDGIFLRPWNYPLPDEGIQLLVDACRAGGGIVQNYHWESRPAATLCTTTYSILHYGANKVNTIKRLILAHAMLLALPGIPMIFFNSLFGMKNWKKWRKLENEARSVVREKYSEELINKLMLDANSVQHKLYKAIKLLLDVRTQHPAMGQQFLVKLISDVPDSVIAWSLKNKNRIVNCYFNLSNKNQVIHRIAAGKSLLGDIVNHGTIRLLPLSYSWIESLS